GRRGLAARVGIADVQRAGRRRRCRPHRCDPARHRAARGNGLLMGDPLFAHGVDVAVVLIVLLKVVLTFVFLLVAVLLYIWWERKFILDLQNRIGRDRAGPNGILPLVAGGVKVMLKEELVLD